MALAVLAVLALLLARLLRRRSGWGDHPSRWTAAMIASDEFLRTPAWGRVRYDALLANDGRCECCGRGKHDGVRLNVDHVKPRKAYPQLALDVRNLQVLCGGTAGCNAGKGNRDATDWRHPGHRHRKAP